MLAFGCERAWRVRGAQAATINGADVGDTITVESINGEKGGHSSKFVIGQGNVSVQTTGSVVQLLSDLQTNLSSAKTGSEILNAVHLALWQDKGQNAADTKVVITGLAGGEGSIDADTLNTISMAGAVFKDYKPLLDKIGNIDTVHTGTLDESNQNFQYYIYDAAGNTYNIDEPTTVTIGGETTEPVVLLMTGGDLSLAAGLQIGSESEQVNNSVYRSNSVKIDINSGNVLGGVGGSAAIGVGNIEALSIVTTDGNASTTIDGSVTTAVNGKANVGAFANGGLAAAIGGTASSVVTGDTKLNVNSTVNGDRLEGLTVAIAGGGAAISTLDGAATSEVGGNTNVSVTDGVSALVVGGGVAAAVDASEIGNQIAHPDGDVQLGMEETYAQDGNIAADFDVSSIKVTLNHVNEGGEATAITKDTTVELKGTTTAAGVIGGGLAAATHGYVGHVNDEINGYSVGNSVAEVTTGKNTINVAMDKSNLDKGKLINAVKQVPSLMTDNVGNLITGLKNIASGAAGNGAALGIIGGGAAVAMDNAINPERNDDTIKDKRYPNADGYKGAEAIATFGGAEINLQSGYAVGTFGGGLAAATNFANATSTTEKEIVINASGAEAIGVWGNGVAYFTGKENASVERNNLAGKATVEAVNTTININGGDYGVDGAYGGGIAIDDSNADTVNAIVKTTGVSTINVSGEVNKLNYEVLENVQDAYLNAIGTTAQDYAIVGGGIAAGGGALSEVEESVISVNSGAQVNGDILAGGIAVLGYTQAMGQEYQAGSYVNTSTINLNSGATVDGSVYAGGAVDDGIEVDGVKIYNEAKVEVKESIINLNGAEVTGQLVGTGVGDATRSTVKSTLNVNGANTLGLAKNSKDEDVSKITGFDTVNFVADSTTTLDGGLQAGGDVAVIDGGDKKGTITVADGARLDVSKLEVAEDGYLVAANYSDNSSLWQDDALAFDRTEYYAYGTEDTKGYSVTYKDLSSLNYDEQIAAIDDFADSFGKYSPNMEGLAREVITNGDEVAQQAPGAKAFFADATTLGSTAAAESAAAGMMMFGEASGVTSNAVSIAQDMADTAALRLSFTQDYVTGDEKVDTDGNIWARYVKNKHDVEGMSSSFGSIYSSSDYDGVMIGADFAKVGKAQSGIAFTYGDGDSHGAGVSNDFDMWGITLFGNIKNDDSNIIADIGYSKSSNDLTGSVMGKRLTADRDLDIFSVGVRAEKLYTNDNLQVVPYAGLRFFSVDPDSYTTYYNGQKAFSYDADRQNLWTLPVGVSLRHETTTNNGWKLTPQVDVSYIWAFGDTDNDMDVTLLGGRSHLNYTVMDSGSWLGTVAFEATKADWTCGLGYSYQKGSDMQSDKWFVNVEYSF